MRVDHKSFQVLLFKIMNSLKFKVLLIYTTEGCAVHSCAEEAPPQQ